MQSQQLQLRLTQDHIESTTRYQLHQSTIQVIRERDTLELYLTNPQEVKELVKTILALSKFDDDQEHFLVISVNTKNRYISHFEAFKGSMDRCTVSAREVFRYALLAGASRIILAHNHPSGVVEPSEEDKRLTVQLVEVGRMIDVKVIDHVIVGNGTNESFSFVDNRLI